MPTGEEVLQRTDFEYCNNKMMDERACKICKVPEPYLQNRKCTADDNDSSSDKESVCGMCYELKDSGKVRKNGKKMMTKVYKKHKGKICPHDKNPELKWGHVIVDTGQKVPIPILSGLGEFKKNPLRRMIGYEIETTEVFDGLKCTALAKEIGAGMVADGGCFEMTTPPANGDKLVELVEMISARIRKYGAKCNGTGAGLHTHVDCRDAGFADMRKIIMLYGKLESGLFSIIDSRRATSGMCKPLGGAGLVMLMSDHVNYKENIIRMVYSDSGKGKGGGGSRGRGKDPQGGDRYVALNLHSWWMRGTIEFRMHHGTTKAEKMIPWGMLLCSMCDIAINRGDKEIDSWPTGLEGLLKVAPTKEVKEWVQQRWDFFAAKRKDKKPLIPEANTNPSAVDDNPYED